MSIEQTITEAVIARMQGCKDARLHSVMASLVRHLHDFVREIEPTEEEWWRAIDFLTRTGQTCDDKRQEFILLSDTLGVSMLVDAIVHRGESGATESTVLGPFYVKDQPVLPLGASIVKGPMAGHELTVMGRILDIDGHAIAGARVEVWQTAPNGNYDVQDPHQPAGNMRGTFVTGADGRYRFTTRLPVSYPIPTDGPVGRLLDALGRHPYRPAHIHFMVAAEGHVRLVTHLFTAGDEYLDSDAVFGVKPSLIVRPKSAGDGVVIEYDFRLQPQQ